MTDVIAIGGGPAGMLAALSAADLGARTALVTRGAFGGMAANDGPIPVRALSRAARLIRDARQLGQYGIAISEPVLDYRRLLARVREVVHDVDAHIAARERIDALGVTIHEHAGSVRFADPHTVVTAAGLRLHAEKIIICTGGVSRRLPVPGFEFTSTHSDAWRLTAVPPSMLVIGGGDTGLQVASIFNAFGSQVQILETAPRILLHADDDVAVAVAAAFRASGIVVRENFGAIESFEKAAAGVRMNFSKNGDRGSAEAALAVVAVGWAADTASMGLATAGVELNQRGFVEVDEYLRTSAPHIFAAGDVAGRLMLVPEAIQDGFVAATNAVRGPTMPIRDRVTPSGSFTDPEFGQVGLTETKARQTRNIVTAVVRFDSTTRTIIDGHKFGFCKLIADADTSRILGCHVVGERAVDIVQTAAIAIAGGMRVDDLAAVPLSFPTYEGILFNAAASAAWQLGLPVVWRAHQIEGQWQGNSATPPGAVPSGVTERGALSMQAS
jgi:pyruvate/2-oxoglutarate dehydrogenase complex dihydrolipoamide dehydrogenase (E3) component